MTKNTLKNYDEYISAEDKISAKLLENNVHFLVGDIESTNTLSAIRWIVYENSIRENDNNILTLYINSFGGNLQDAFALIDVMRKSNKIIRTIGIGSICSAAFLIFAAGTKGERFISQNTSIMCHQYYGETSGKFHDMQATMKENKLLNERMITILVESTGLDSRTVKSKLLPPSDVWFSAQEILELGVADKIF